MHAKVATYEQAAGMRRLGAYLLDLVVIYLYIILLFLASMAVNDVLPFHEAMGASYVLRHLISFTTLTLPVVLYFMLMEHSRWQGTVGKKLLKMRVVGQDGSRATLQQLAVRNAIKFLPWEVAHLHIHLNPDFLFTGHTSTLGLLFGSILPFLFMTTYAGMVFFRKDGRSLYELISHTRVVKASPAAAPGNVRTVAAICLTLLCAPSLPATAQQAPRSQPHLMASIGYLSVGSSQGQTDGLNQSLQAYNVPGVAEGTLSLGFGGGVFLNRWFFGGDGDIYLGRRSSGDVFHARTMAGTGLVHAGYALAKGRSFIIYPSLGGGVGGSELHIQPVDKGGAPTQQAAFDPNTRLHASFLAASLRLHGDFFIGPRSRTGNLLLGWSVGYNIALLHSGWRVRRGTANQPEALDALHSFDTSGFTMKVKIGWGVTRFAP
ncbi:MAG TPA: RDD family protein [Rhodothermales bacterium]|nr:RDD family protein [Rhodothermales bacterium]